MELNSLCKHIIKVRSSQLVISSTELNKTQFFPLSIVNVPAVARFPKNRVSVTERRNSSANTLILIKMYLV